jgi:hypothetical protein
MFFSDCAFPDTVRRASVFLRQSFKHVHHVPHREATVKARRITEATRADRQERQFSNPQGLW